MLSKKLTFSLTSLVMLLAIGLVFTPVAMAAIGTVPKVNLEVTDVSSAPKGQIEVYAAIPTTALTTAEVDTAAEIETLNTTAKIAADAGGGVVFYLKITNEGVASLNSDGASVRYNTDTPPELFLRLTLLQMKIFI